MYQKQSAINEKHSESKPESCEVPSRYTPILQPCDVGINKMLKSKLQSHAHNLHLEQAALKVSGEALPALTRENTVFLLHEL